MKKALGKGLEALIPQKEETFIEIDIERIIPNDMQPRKDFPEESLRELAQSIKEKGVLQPIVVSRVGDGTFRIVVGERRWRAAKIAGFEKIPAIIKDVSAEEAAELALIENIQREDLDPVEIALCFEKLINDFNLTQEELSKRVGKDRATIANYLRILKLPDKIKEYLRQGVLTMGHAKAIASVKDAEKQIEIADYVITKALSVRQTEEFVRGIYKRKKKVVEVTPEIRELEETLSTELGTKVKIHHKGKKGKLEIFYSCLDELDGILQRIFRKSFLDS
ncbi:MAG: ParB/RepB/Spo0J family partition protein [Thermodesulfovibrio sp.]|nr:ParB/RepB/Spo0J family partition protein [Thermodesulfovibrio sp.]